MKLYATDNIFSLEEKTRQYELVIEATDSVHLCYRDRIRNWIVDDSK